jgi:hypothetical protein
VPVTTAPPIVTTPLITTDDDEDVFAMIAIAPPPRPPAPGVGVPPLPCSHELHMFAERSEAQCSTARHARPLPRTTHAPYVSETHSNRSP